MGFQVAKKRCDQCLFSKAKIVGDDRRDDLLQTCAAEDKHFVCHKFTIAEGDSQVCCRGFYDQEPTATNLMRIAGRLDAVEFVDLPADPTSQRAA